MRYVILALLVVAAACAFSCCGCGDAPRAVSDPSMALLGHWKPASSGPAHIYFGTGTAVYVSSRGGEAISVPYRVVEENAAERRIKLAYGDPGEESEPFVIEFSEDARRLFIYPASAPEVLEYVFVDERRRPGEQ